MEWHAAELATTSANAAAAILIMVIVAGHNSDRAHPKEKPRGEAAGLWEVYRAWTEPAEARPTHLPAGGRRQCDVTGATMRLSTGSGAPRATNYAAIIHETAVATKSRFRPAVRKTMAGTSAGRRACICIC